VIDFRSDETHLLLNPRLPAAERERLERAAASAVPLRGHVLVATSGSTGALKLVALSKDAILASAEAVNRHLGAGSTDDWICVLPPFHVGGLGIHARAYLAGAKVVTAEWEPHQFVRLAERAAFSALVPAQVHDLVREGLRAPAMRAVVVGGGALDDAAWAAARALGWPLLRSYGMTECCSQVATETFESPELRVLHHLEARTEPDGRIAVRGASLLTGYILEEGTLADPKRDGWFVTEDLGWVDGGVLRVEGRGGDFVKVGGESVDLGRLDRIVAELAGDQAAIVAVPDARLGHVIHLASTTEPGGVVTAFNERVLPFERVRAAHRVGEIPRSPLGKLLRGKLLQLIEEKRPPAE
jgi:O-succinylbenzoic acid--CoA ligase